MSVTGVTAAAIHGGLADYSVVIADMRKAKHAFLQEPVINLLPLEALIQS